MNPLASSALRREGIDPTQPGKARKISIGGAKREPVLDGQRREVGIGDEFASAIGL